MKRIYIAGPMRGKPASNFPAFDEARERFKAIGWEVVSPADLDRAQGFNEHSPASLQAAREAILRDVPAVASCNALAVLPGWEDSLGASVELALARYLGLELYDATGHPLDATILDEAKRLTRGERNEAYGPPIVEHDQIAKYWSVLFHTPITAELVAMAMVLVKIARNQHKHKRDNMVDIAGYADCCQRIVEARKDMYKEKATEYVPIRQEDGGLVIGDLNPIVDLSEENKPLATLQNTRLDLSSSEVCSTEDCECNMKKPFEYQCEYRPLITLTPETPNGQIRIEDMVADIAKRVRKDEGN